MQWPPNGDSPPRTTKADQISERMLSLAFPFSQATSTGGLSELFGATLALIHSGHSDKPGLEIGLSGDGEAEFQLSEKWKVALEARATPAFSMVLKAEGGRPGFGAHEPTGIPLNVALMSIPDESDVSFALPWSRGDQDRDRPACILGLDQCR